MASQTTAVRPRTARTPSMLEANYPRNCWWMAARADEVTGTPLGIWMLDEPIVLFRNAAGAVVALDNRCPHRWAPLSEGVVHGDAIACPYHGFQFGSDGACVHIPSQQTIPNRLRVKSYAVVERGPTVWLWMGDRERADLDLLPDLGFLDDPEWVLTTGEIPINANYRLLKENVLDLTHAPHVHAKTLAIQDWTEPPSVELGDKGEVTYVEEFAAGPLPRSLMPPSGVRPDQAISRTVRGTSYTPAFHRTIVTLRDADPAPGAPSEWLWTICHVTTPVSPNAFVYRWFTGWKMPSSPEYLQALLANTHAAFLEDKHILEATQALVERDPRGVDSPEMIMQADRAPIQFRRNLDKMLAAEAASPSDGLQ